MGGGAIDRGGLDRGAWKEGRQEVRGLQVGEVGGEGVGRRGGGLQAK